MESEPRGTDNSWGMPVDRRLSSPRVDGSGSLLVEQEEESGRSKRPKVGLACQRCKQRKKRCDGCHPCSACKTSHALCEFVASQKHTQFGKNQYIRSLESRVAELETLLSAQGLSQLSSDHWRATSPNNGTGISREAAPSEDRSTFGRSGSGPRPPAGDPLDLDSAVLDWEDGSNMVTAILRSLSLDANGSGYIGASSYMAMGRLLPFLGGQGKRRGGVASPDGRASRWRPIDAVSPTESLMPIDLVDVPNQIADRLFGGYMKHIATRVPVIHSVWVRDVHRRRHSLTNVFETTVLHLVYATSGRFLETTGESGHFHVKRHYLSAVQVLNAILEFDDIRTIQVLMLMALYCLRDPVGPGAWTCSRIALLVGIEHGLHRQIKQLSQVSLQGELRKRLFWACYDFDRQISIPMGRPFGISDRDIDLGLPLDVNEDATEEQLTHATASIEPPTTSTSLTSFIHVTRLRQIESDIQQTIYRVDRCQPIDESVTEDFLARIEQWKSMIPPDSHNVPDVGDVPYEGYDFYLIHYYQCLRLLLYPLICDVGVKPRFLKECARACAGVCSAYRRLHQIEPVGFSFMAVQTIFMAGKPADSGALAPAGLTLAYCIWISPDEVFDPTASRGIHDCSILLFVVAERLPAAKTYRNVFEIIRERLVDQISRTPGPRPRPRETVVGLSAELAPSMQSFDVNMSFEADNEGYGQFSHIIADITGENLFAGMNRVDRLAPSDPAAPDLDPTALFDPQATWATLGL